MRRIERTVRMRIQPLLEAKPRILHLVYQEPSGPNRGDAVMGLAIPQILRRVEPGLNIRHFKIGDLNQRRPLRGQLGPCEMVIVGGGGLYGKWHTLDKLLELEELKIPLVLYGLGLIINHGDGPLAPEKLETITRLNRFAVLSSVRDRSTQLFLRELGFDSHLIADPAAFYEPPGREFARRAPGSLRVGINLPCHGFHQQREVLSRVVPIMRAFCERLKSEGAVLHYMLHYPDEEWIVEQLGVDFAVVNRGNAQELARGYHDLDFMIGGMLHSSIFAFAAGVPFLTLAYDSKHEGFLELAGVRDNCLELRSLELDALEAMARGLLEKRETISAGLRQAREPMWKAHRGFAASVVASLKSSGAGGAN